MRLPFGDTDVTLLRRTAQIDPDGRRREAFEPAALSGCSWRSARLAVEAGGARPGGAEAVCRIPAGQAVPVEGDLLLRGTVDPGLLDGDGRVSARTAARLLRERGDGAMSVGAVEDRTRGPLPHVRCVSAGRRS